MDCWFVPISTVTPGIQSNRKYSGGSFKCQVVGMMLGLLNFVHFRGIVNYRTHIRREHRASMQVAKTASASKVQSRGKRNAQQSMAQQEGGSLVTLLIALLAHILHERFNRSRRGTEAQRFLWKGYLFFLGVANHPNRTQLRPHPELFRCRGSTSVG